MGVADKINTLTQKYYDCHLVNCGACGNILNQNMHRDGEDGDIKCPICGFEEDPCHFPDFFYEE